MQTQPQLNIPSQPQTEEQPLLLRVAQVAERLALSKAMVYAMVSTGQLTGVRIGRAVRVPAASLEAFVSANCR